MRKILHNFCFIIIALLFAEQSYAQNLSAYHNYRDQFYVFDQGKTIYMEHLPVESFQVGNNLVAYLDNSWILKVYENGQKKRITNNISNFILTDNILAFDNARILYVYDNGQTKKLSIKVTRYEVGDDVVVFFDDPRQLLQVYYQGEIHKLDDALGYPVLDNFKAGDNIVGFVDKFNYLKVFYEGQIEEIMLTEIPVYYKVSKNTLAYINHADQSFNAFYKGETYELSPFPPQSYKVADDRVCFVNDAGALMLFDHRELYEVDSFEPDFYEVTEQLVIFSKNDELKAFYNNQIFDLENYIPAKYIADQDKLLYLDQNNHLKVFDKGEQKILSYEQINRFELHNQVVTFNIGVNTVKHYFEGEVR